MRLTLRIESKCISPYISYVWVKEFLQACTHPSLAIIWANLPLQAVYHGGSPGSTQRPEPCSTRLLFFHVGESWNQYAYSNKSIGAGWNCICTFCKWFSIKAGVDQESWDFNMAGIYIGAPEIISLMQAGFTIASHGGLPHYMVHGAAQRQRDGVASTPEI